MDRRKIIATFMLMLLTACTPQETVVAPTATEPAFIPTATTDPFAFSEYLPAESIPTATVERTKTPTPNAATLQVQELITPTQTPTRLPTSTPNLPRIVEIPCSDLKEQIPLNILDELAITYVYSGAVFMWRGSDCSIQQLTNFENIRHIRVLGDKKVIIFEKFFPHEEYSYAGTIEVWVMNLDGTGQKLLLNRNDFESFYEERQLEFSEPYEIIGLETKQIRSIPNSDLILFSTQIIVTPFPDWSNDLRLLNVKTGELTTIFKANQAGEFFLSPDATKVAITSPTSLSVYDFTTGKLTANLLTFEIPAYGTHCCYYAKPVWAAASDRFLVSIPPEEPHASDARVTLWKIDVNTFSVRELGKYPGILPIRFNESLAPDLQHFAIYFENELQIHDISAGDPSKPIFVDDVRLIDWNANSTNFLYSVGDDIFVGSLDEEPMKINSPKNQVDFDAAFWIDAQYFIHAYEVRDSGKRLLNIFLGSIDGASILILSLPEESITSISVKRIP